MKSKFVSILMIIFGLLISPLLVVVLGGLIWIGYYLSQGIGIAMSINTYYEFLKWLSPYFPYLTIIPMLCVAVPLLLKYKNKIKEVLHK